MHMSDAVRVRGEAAEVSRAEAQAVMAMLDDEHRRARLADVVAAVEDGQVEGDDAAALGELLELGLQTGRLRSVYGPEGEQAALGLFRRLPQGKEISQSTSELNEALEALSGRALEKLSVHAVGPGEYGVSISAEGFELVIRLGRSGARISTVGA
jgi:hypothetical protein